MRLRPDASKHIDLLLPDPSADRAAAAGWEAYQRGDVATARASLSVAAASPAAEAWVHYALGQSEYALGAYASAVAAWEKVRQAASTFEPVYFDLVDGYLQLKQHDKAIRLLREGASNWPKDPDIFNALGVVHTVRGTLPDAIASFRQAIDAAPGEAVSYFNLGRALRAAVLPDPPLHQADEALDRRREGSRRGDRAVRALPHLRRPLRRCRPRGRDAAQVGRVSRSTNFRNQI